MDDLRKFALYFRPYKKSLVVGVLCILGGTVVGLLIPIFVGQAVDDLGAGPTWEKITRSALLVVGASAVSGIFLFLQRRILIGMSRHVEYDLRQDFYAHLQRQPLSFFHEHRTGDLMARATNDLAAVRQLAGPMVMYTLQTVFVVLIILPLMLRISVRLTLLLFVTMPLVSLTVKYFGQQVHARFEKIQDFFSQITARAQENITGVRVVRAYAQEDGGDRGLQPPQPRVRDAQPRASCASSAVMRPLIQFVIGLGMRADPLVRRRARRARRDDGRGSSSSSTLYLMRLIWPLIALGYVVNLYQRGTASLKRMNAVFAAEPAITDRAGREGAAADPRPHRVSRPDLLLRRAPAAPS